MSKKIVGLEHDGISTKIIYNDNGTFVAEDLKVGMTTIEELQKV
jgi:hypothetical protein|tara:strand:- start:2348 stop:2479 length:132 start_codon:yes stop_codon:yes gene_type:complete